MTPAAFVTGCDAQIPDRVVGFLHHLRKSGFMVGTEDCARIAEHLSRRPLPPVSRMCHELKVLLTGNREEWRRFDKLFEAYWLPAGHVRTRAARTSSPHVRNPLRQDNVWQDHLSNRRDGLGGDAPRVEAEGVGPDASGEAAGRLVATLRSVNRKTDLKHVVDPDEIREAEAVALRLAKAMRYRLSRRHRTSARRLRIDLRRTIRHALARGGEPIELLRRERQDRPVHIVVFLDVSGSMEHYSRFLLQFVKGLACSWLHSEAFIFHTRLIRVTDALRDRNPARAMTRLALMAEGFGGGTRIGESLATFNRHYARRIANSRTVAIILSDGYDTGTPEMLATELEGLKKHIRRLVWLNPLLGWQSYAPVTAAIQSARPHIDHFAPANTLESLAAIEPELARI
ncbi:MAG: VWA domain-containing protein [Boseongicola sp.]|nr:VWA domain-containing protein [Boseongicola sp.]